jgi:phosphoribosyl-AMP cyclohydrolase
MKRILFIVLLVVVAAALYFFVFKKEEVPEGPKQQPLALKDHTDAFTKNVDSLLEDYFVLTAAFVDGDSLKAKQASISLLGYVNRFSLDELKKDTTGIYQTASDMLGFIKGNLESMGKSQTITDMRHDFKDLSENLYPLLKTVHYKGKTLYWQNCGMPFTESSSANWISTDAEIVNPYLGKNHPVYKSGMLHCGETQDSIKAQ